MEEIKTNDATATINSPPDNVSQEKYEVSIAGDSKKGKTCPFCKTEILENDEIIICPACNTPHHKGCWEENKGCTTFGCVQKKKPDSESSNALICASCGAELHNDSQFCPSCGAKQEQISEQNIEAASRTTVCSSCGAELTEGQTFCPKCGQKTDLNVESDVSLAIAQFNSNVEKNNKKSKKKKKVMVPIIITIIVLALAAVGGYFYLNNIYNDIVSEIKSSSPDVGEISDNMKKLTPVGESLFADDINKAFAKTVKNNPYSDENSSGNLVVNEDAIETYEVYSDIADAIKCNDHQLRQYIDDVVSLKGYSQYNNVSKCVVAAHDDFTDAIDYMNDAAGFSTYYYVKLYVAYAKNSMYDAYLAANAVNNGDPLSEKYCNALYDYYDLLNDLYNGYGAGTSTAAETIKSIANQVRTAFNEVESIVDNLPELD